MFTRASGSGFASDCNGLQLKVQDVGFGFRV